MQFLNFFAQSSSVRNVRNGVGHQINLVEDFISDVHWGSRTCVSQKVFQSKVVRNFSSTHVHYFLKIILESGSVLDTVHVNSMLTARQQEILSFIQAQQQSRGVTPSTREIQMHFGFGSQTAVMDHLKALERKGMLERPSGKARALILKTFVSHASVFDIPVFGTIPAGVPTDQSQESDGSISIDFDNLKLPKGAQVFALKVRGDSMVDAGIYEEDTVILECKEPRHKDVVAALIDGETTLKRYLVEQGTPFLRAENPKYSDLSPVQELVIQGVMIGLLRLVK